jgi:DNA helicase-2/ATP-dependent DNA helicase PcrA
MQDLPELNGPQAEAVAHASGPLLVFAGAGSGKTRVITYRIANLVARERVAPWRILAVTFTNKAAGEMRARLEREDLLGPIARDLWVGTFHATCAKFLRLFPEAIERTRSFVIYDSTDQKAVVTRVLRDMQLDDKRYAPKGRAFADPEGEAGGARARRDEPRQLSRRCRPEGLPAV